jgi:hypothetical protein
VKSGAINMLRISAVAMLFFCAGCGTTFKYNPKHDQTYPAIPDNLGFEIASGIDDRPSDEKQPVWSRSVEVIVARALADEIKHAELFQRVKIHLTGPAHLDKYSYFVEFRVGAFRTIPQTGALEQFGRSALGVLGWRGFLISASIPTTWESDVKVQFEVFDAVNQKLIFRQTYSETRSLKANGYEGKTRQIQQTSDCLEGVVQQFVAEFSRAMH